MTDNKEIKRHVTEFNSESLPIKEHILQLIEIIRPKHAILIAGGAVRDHIWGDIPKDIDLCTSATPDELSELLTTNDIKIKPVGKAFGITIAVLKDDKDRYEEVEIATFRTDGVYLDGRRPESVDFVDSPREDAIRRDLTINGLFYDTSDDTIIDYVDGIKDMEDGVLRFIGDPCERIREDKLRMLRYVRFLLKTDFEPDESSEQAIRDNAEQIKAVSVERIKEELDKMFAIGPVSRALKLLEDLNLLEYVLPGVPSSLILDNLPDSASNELCWAAVFLLDKDLAKETCKRMRFSNKESEKILWLIENRTEACVLPLMSTVEAKRFVLNDKLNDINPYFYDLLALVEASIIGDEAFAFILDRFQDIKYDLNRQKEAGIDFPKLITGNDVMEALGLETGGSLVGEILDRVRDALLKLKTPTRMDALGLLYQFALED